MDFEFGQEAGGLPVPRCLVAHELFTSRAIQTWLDDGVTPAAPFSLGSDALFVSYFASAELGCYLALGWALPANVLDLYAEFRCQTNGLSLPAGSGLMGALVHYGLPAIDACEKNNMRGLALRGAPYSYAEKEELLAYCESDVQGLARLLRAMADHVDLDRALVRGRYMGAVAKMQQAGVPIDEAAFEVLTKRREEIAIAAIGEVDAEFGVYEGAHFRSQRWEQWLDARRIDWPRSESGRLILDRESFQEAGARRADVKPFSDLREFLNKMRAINLTVGPDGRNRSLLSPFRSATGRNQPSGSRFIFGAPSWMRGLIQPPPGRGLAYIDWSQQEFGIAAALSRDPGMMAAYRKGDPYLAFAQASGAVPASATAGMTLAIRERFKICALGVQYGMGADTLATRIRQSPAHARELLFLHQSAFSRFWEWSDAVLDHAMLTGQIRATFGWQLRVNSRTKPGTLRNFPMQANGAEMLRIACVLATERGVEVCAPVHDAILIEAPTSALEEACTAAREAMAEASRLVLAGFELRTSVQKVVHPRRLIDHKSRTTWDRVMRITNDLERGRNNDGAPTPTRPLSSISTYGNVIDDCV